MPTELCPDDLARLFVNAAFSRSYCGTIKAMEELLTRGPAGRGRQPALRELQQQFASLAPDAQSVVRRAVEQAAELAGFSIITMLDNLAGGAYSEGCVGKLKLLFVPDDASKCRVQGTAHHVGVQINTGDKGFLHDMFLERLPRA